MEIPMPEDFGLDVLVDDVFSGQNYWDFIPEKRVQWYAKNIVYHPETDEGTIRRRQESLSSVMGNPELISLVQKSVINEIQENDLGIARYSNVLDRASAYLRVLEGLDEKIPETTNGDLGNLRQHVNNLLENGERVGELRRILGDIDGNTKLSLKAKFTAEPHYSGTMAVYKLKKIDGEVV